MKQIQNQLQIISGMLLSIQGTLIGGIAGKIVTTLGAFIVLITTFLYIKEIHKK